MDGALDKQTSRTLGNFTKIHLAHCLQVNCGGSVDSQVERKSRTSWDDHGAVEKHDALGDGVVVFFGHPNQRLEKVEFLAISERVDTLEVGVRHFVAKNPHVHRASEMFKFFATLEKNAMTIVITSYWCQYIMISTGTVSVQFEIDSIASRLLLLCLFVCVATCCFVFSFNVTNILIMHQIQPSISLLVFIYIVKNSNSLCTCPAS